MEPSPEIAVAEPKVAEPEPEPKAPATRLGNAPRRRSRSRRVAAALFGAIFGFIFGTGLGLLLSQTGALDMNSSSSLVAPAGGTVLGVLIGWTGGRSKKA